MTLLWAAARKTETFSWKTLKRSVRLRGTAESGERPRSLSLYRVLLSIVIRENRDNSYFELTSSSLNQERLSAVSTNQYSLAPPFMMLMLLMVSQPLRMTWGEGEVRQSKKKKKKAPMQKTVNTLGTRRTRRWQELFIHINVDESICARQQCMSCDGMCVCVKVGLGASLWLTQGLACDCVSVQSHASNCVHVVTSGGPCELVTWPLC